MVTIEKAGESRVHATCKFQCSREATGGLRELEFYAGLLIVFNLGLVLGC